MMKQNTLLHTNASVCIIIIIGFITTSVISYKANKGIFEKDIEHVSTLTSEGIYYQIDTLLTKPVTISLTMANDSLLKSFLAEENLYLDNDAYIRELRNYLYAYREKYAYDSVFLVSAATGRYYHYNGLDRVLTPDYEENMWYYQFLTEDEEYSLNVDNDEASDNVITVFVNCKIKDINGAIMGVVGVGLRIDSLQELLRGYDEEFDISAFLINGVGTVEVSSAKTKFENINLFDNPVYADFKNIILHNKTGMQTFWYSTEAAAGFVVSQYVPNLKWYLVVENDMSAIDRELRIQFFITVLVITLIVLLVLITITGVIRKYNARLVNIASHDPLTGIYNRGHYETVIESCNNNLKTFTHIGIVIMDLNGLKGVNDIYGHHAGDEYIQKSCALICSSFAGCDVFRIGGDEFAVIFKNITEAKVKLMVKNMLENIEKCNIGRKIKMSIAYGYSFYDSAHDGTLENTFLRADRNMYLKKEEMKKI